MAVNNLYQPWRAILSMINQCLTSKTSRHDRPRYPVLHVLWGIITSTNVDYAELMWEEFIQAIQTFLTDKANLGSPTKKGRKDKPHVILYCRFTKLIICHLGRIHNIHQRSASPFYLTEEDLKLGNLKFVSKDKADEVFGMPFPNEPISNNIRNAPYYNAYLEMITKHDQKVLVEKEGKRKTASAKQPKPKPAIEKSSKPAPAPKPKLVDEPDEEPTQPKPEPEPEPEHQGEGDEYDIERAIQMSLESFQAQTLHTPKREGPLDPQLYSIGRTLQGTEERHQQDPLHNHRMTHPPILFVSLHLQQMPKHVLNHIRQTVEVILQITEELGEDVDKQLFMDEGPVFDQTPGEAVSALAGPDPKPMHDEFMANLYPKVQESLKFLADEHVILENPLSSTETLSSMKNLEEAYIIGDQFINEKSTKDEPRKLNREAEVKFSDLEQRNKNLDNTTQNIGSRVFTLELRDLPHKIDETVKEAVQVTVKRCRDNQDTPPPPPDSDLNKKKRHDSGTSGSSQPPAPQLSAWKKSNTRDTSSSSPKQQFGHHSEKSVEDIPMLDTANISDSQDN
ncbi:hypothetical protein Tco_0592939 [Tanacetum coccineum]